jgi:hypothetical protein
MELNGKEERSNEMIPVAENARAEVLSAES